MNAATWRRVEALVDAAAELSPGERERILEERCAGEPRLRSEVERVLEALDAGGNFLDRASWAPYKALAENDADETPSMAGHRFGPYRIEGFLGSGGMGSVYKARRDDGQFHRNVAIKILRFDPSDEEAIRRFRAERQILAQLSHPILTELLDGGTTEDGRPYIVMELVDGVPIDVYCDRHELSVEARLRLFLVVCDAVRYAHRHLIVHRDLKASNILVDAEGTPKLLDFGIAKLLDAPRFQLADRSTRTGFRPLTLHTASPEQITGEAVTTASDVYALGVLLYRLLTGRSPYRLGPGEEHEIVRAILEEEPERPSDALTRTSDGEAAEAMPRCGLRPGQLRQRLKNDLDTILLMALRKRPERRYGSVEELADDIERHLASRPVSARPDTLIYKAAKLVRRHPLGVSAGLAAAVLLVVFTAFALWQASRIARERDLAELQGARQEQIANFLLRLFENANPRNEVAATELTVRDVLDRGRRQIDELDDLPEVQATYLNTMGEAYRALALYDEASTLLERALALRRQSHGDNHLEVAESLYELSIVHHLEGDFEAAEAAASESLAIRRRLLGDAHPLVASCLNQLGLIVAEGGRYAEAEERYREALAITAGRPSMDTADSLHNLALLTHDRGQLEEAESLYREALAMTRRFLGPVHPDVAISLNSLAVLLHDREDLEGAEARYREALTMRRQLFGDEHHAVATSLTNLALLLQEKGDQAEAEAIFAENLEVSRRLLGPDHLDVAVLLNNFALLKHDRGDLEGAERMYLESLAIRRERLGDDHVTVSWSLGNLAALYQDLGSLEEAEAFFQQALAIDRVNFGDDHPDVAYSLHGLAEALFFQGKAAEAEAMLRDALDMRRRHLGEDHSATAATAVILARVLLNRGEGTAARDLLDEAVTVLRLKKRADHWRLAYAEAVLAAAVAPEDRGRAEALFARAMPVLERVLPHRSPFVEDSLALAAASGWMPAD